MTVVADPEVFRFLEGRQKLGGRVQVLSLNIYGLLYGHRMGSQRLTDTRCEHLLNIYWRAGFTWVISFIPH